jgi:hypothetical protein
MAAPNTRTTDKKVVQPVKSIHIVVLGCPNCGEEVEELKLCKECNSPMKVVQVIEKFGSDAEEYLAQLKREGVWGMDSVRPNKGNTDEDVETDDLDEELEIPIRGLTEEVVDDDAVSSLGDIFPDDGAPSTVVPDVDFQDALRALDEEEEDVTKDLEDLGPEGLPEL